MSLKVLGSKSIGKIFILSAPAGTGKTTLARMLCKEFNCVVESISYTTRAARPNEIENVDYFFIDKEKFQEMIDAEEFLEYAEVFGKLYGTSKHHVKEQLEKGKHVILVIDTQGALKLKQEGYKASYIFIKPPSLLELKERLFKRSTESTESVMNRLSWAENEIAQATKYDYVIVNDNLAHAYDILRSIIIAEEHRVE